MYKSLLVLAFYICFYFGILYLLTLRRTLLPPYNKPLTLNQKSSSTGNGDSIVFRTLTSAHVILFLAVAAAALLLLLATVLPPDDPVLQCEIRNVAFFFACKILDLAVAHGRAPPTLLTGAARKPASMATTKDRLWYAYLLLTETRYHAFDIAVVERSRGPPLTLRSHLAWTYGPAITAGALFYLFPAVTEIRVFFLLMCIHAGLETAHHLFHPFCPHPLFYKPLAASSFNEFWSTNWHAGASSFLRSLAYEPGKRLGGRPVGVFSAFALSGIWHGWNAAPLSTKPWQTMIQVTLLFIMMGVGALAERKIWKVQGTLVQRIVVWVFAIGCAGRVFRTIECSSKLDMLKGAEC